MALNLRRVEQWLCGLHGHDSVVHFDRNRMWLECVTCGRETPGWTLQPRSAPANPRTRTWPARAAA